MMLAIDVIFLSGRAVASQVNDDDQPEWPIHPGRVFLALVATLMECELEPDDSDGPIHQALRWLERLTPPTIAAPLESDTTRRKSVPVVVPVNDAEIAAHGEGTNQVQHAQQLLPENRSRQPRSFPSMTLPADRPVVTYIWGDAVADEVGRHRPALEKLFSYVIYMGHSSSMVALRWNDSPPSPTVRPDDRGRVMLRVPAPGRFDALLTDFHLASAANRAWRPSAGLYASYAHVPDSTQTAAPPQSILRDLILLRCVDGPGVGLANAHWLTFMVRRALLDLAGNAPEVLSGHSANGRPTTQPHMAILPMPFIDAHHASGHLMGLTLALPGEIPDADRTIVYYAIGELREILLGESGTWCVERVDPHADLPWSLRLDHYMGPALQWATITPMLFGRYPRIQPCDREVAEQRLTPWRISQGLAENANKWKQRLRREAEVEALAREAADLVGEACDWIGLPRPIRVNLTGVSQFRGVPQSRQFGLHRFRAEHLPTRLYSHVEIEFAEPVEGPVVLGAGRYYGLGLFRILRDPSIRSEHE